MLKRSCQERGLKMVNTCKGLCSVDKRFGKSSPYYAKGVKYCTHCAKKIFINELRCPCCRCILRTRTHHYKSLARKKRDLVRVP